jgi:subtilisin family serine protease
MLVLALLFVAVVSAQNFTRYIVVFKNDMTTDELNSHIASSLGGVQPTHLYQHVLKGFAAHLSPEQLVAVQKHPKFDFLEEDQIMHALETEDVEQSCRVQNSPGSWGLVRICQRQRRNEDGSYHYPPHQGEGVIAYIVDTGIYVDNVDFEKRAVFGWRAETGSGWSLGDGNGHGTHVASTVGGVKYGVAKKVSLIAVKVLSDAGSGSNAGVIAGVDWTVSDFLTNRRGKKAIANLSLGGGRSVALNNACNSAMEAGVFMAVAAGNDNADACNSSPASATEVVTVGSTANGDTRSSFSNYGSCVDIFAPGSSITAAWKGPPTTAINTISGTSMASPHVAGVGALLLADHPNLSAKAIKALMNGDSTKDILELNCANAACRASPNRFLWNTCNNRA